MSPRSRLDGGILSPLSQDRLPLNLFIRDQPVNGEQNSHLEAEDLSQSNDILMSALNEHNSALERR